MSRISADGSFSGELSEQVLLRRSPGSQMNDDNWKVWKLENRTKLKARRSSEEYTSAAAWRLRDLRAVWRFVHEENMQENLLKFHCNKWPAAVQLCVRPPLFTNHCLFSCARVTEVHSAEGSSATNHQNSVTTRWKTHSSGCELWHHHKSAVALSVPEEKASGPYFSFSTHEWRNTPVFKQKVIFGVLWDTAVNLSQWSVTTNRPHAFCCLVFCCENKKWPY